MATVVPRLKKRRLSPDAATPLSRDASAAASAAMAAAAYLQAPTQPLYPSTPSAYASPTHSHPMAGSSLTPIAPDLVMHSPHVPREAGGAGAGGETYRPRASVVEMINGHEQQVYLVSDDEDDDQDGPPPASPLAQPLTAPRPTTMTTTGKRKAQAPWEFTATSAVDEGPAKRRRHDPPSSMALSTPVTPHLHHPALHQPPPSHYHMPTMNEPAAAASIYPIPETLLSPYAKSQSSYAAAEAWRPSFASSTTTTTVPRVEHVPLDDKDGHIIVREGDYITPRYQIRRLLGQGTFGKVVQCYDRKQHRDVAIKVIRAIQKYRDASQIEIRVLKCLRQNDPSNKYRCVQLLETLDFRNHVCIVSDLLDRSVFDFLKDNKFQPFPCRDIWSFAHQLLKSVAFLHRLSLIHTDLKPENVLLVDSAFDVVPTSRRSNARKKRVLRNSEIRLIDFGSATFSDEYHSGVVSTRHYRAPEIILGMGWSFPCDVWSIGCILVEFYTGEALFQTHDNLEHLAMMEMVLGKLPDDYRRKAETYKPDYFMHGRLDYPRHDTTKQSRRYVQSMKPLADIVAGPSAYAKHAREFVSLLRRLLEYDPAKRITVQEALEHPYFMLQPHELPP